MLAQCYTLKGSGKSVSLEDRFFIAVRFYQRGVFDSPFCKEPVRGFGRVSGVKTPYRKAKCSKCGKKFTTTDFNPEAVCSFCESKPVFDARVRYDDPKLAGLSPAEKRAKANR